MTTKLNINKTKRSSIKILLSLPLIGTFFTSKISTKLDDTENEYVIVRGWILKKTDFY